jgi:hypothetical protein
LATPPSEKRFFILYTLQHFTLFINTRIGLHRFFLFMPKEHESFATALCYGLDNF